MITRCSLTFEAAEKLREVLGLPKDVEVGAALLEFREVPYFIVSRSRDKWTEEQGDINTVRLMGMNDKGLLADPDNSGKAKLGEVGRLTLIPWPNVISLTVERV